MNIKTALLSIFLSFCSPLQNFETEFRCAHSVPYDGNMNFKTNDTVLHENAIEATTVYDMGRMKKYGKPECVVTFTQNATHTHQWYGPVSINVLPVECKFTVEMRCFTNLQLTNIVKNPTKSFFCCCSYDMCNHNNPRYYSEIQAGTLKVTALGSYRFAGVVFLHIVLLHVYTFLERSSYLIYSRLIRVYIIPDTENGAGNLESDHNIEFYEMPDLSINATQVDPVAEAEDQKRVDEYIADEEERAEKLRLEKLEAERSRVPPDTTCMATGKSRMGVPPAATPRRDSLRPNRNLPAVPKSTKRGPATARSIRSDPDKKEKKRKAGTYTPWKKKRRVKKDKNAIETESTQEDEVYAIPPKPASRVLQGGRVQGTSMNYNESTFSDLI